MKLPHRVFKNRDQLGGSRVVDIILDDYFMVMAVVAIAAVMTVVIPTGGVLALAIFFLEQLPER